MTDVLVIGAGPYGLACAHAARLQGFDVTVLGNPMSFWREHMPAGMFLRSGADWHFDAAGELTYEAFEPAPSDPIPVASYLVYAGWFQREAGIEARDEEVIRVEPCGGARARGQVAGRGDDGASARRHGAGPSRGGEPAGFFVRLASGATISARAVVAAPGVSRFGVIPEWGAGIGEHTCDLVDFSSLSGARVVIVGGRQSAYEWAALIGEAGAERVDVVHRHPEPAFERVSWAFTDPHLEATLAVDGWWRRLLAAERDAIARRFWEVGRLTLEHWLAPRLARLPVHRHPNTDVVGVEGRENAREAIAGDPGARAAGDRDVAAAGDPGDGVLRLRLSDGTRLNADRVVVACGYRADVERVPYLPPVAATDGFPDLDESFGSSIPGLYLPGFLATRDFGPYFGFVRGVPAAATIIARALAMRLGN